MKRTNIYLPETQCAALEQASRARGISKAELIRQLVDSALGGGQQDDLANDLSAIDEAFGILSRQDDFLVREPDDRARHLDRIAGR